MQGRGLPTLGEPKAERKGRSEAEVCTSEARKIGEALAPREGSALRKAWFPYSRAIARHLWGGRCGKERPAQKGGGEPKGRRQGGIPPLHFVLIEEVIFNTFDVISALSRHAQAILEHEFAQSISIHQDHILFQI